MEHLNSVRAALRASAPVIAIPVPGHAPVCIRAKLLKGALKGVCVKGDDVSPWKVAKALWYANDDDEIVDVPEPQQDQLGLGIVLYWPYYEWPKDHD
jgi:hypothetical protein